MIIVDIGKETPITAIFQVYNTCTHLSTEYIYNVDANLDAFDNVISGDQSSS